jgi:hypothetical protein
VTESHAINLSTASDTNLGRFARLALATHLLSVVFRHVSEKDKEYSEVTFEVKQLNRTINALIVLCELEEKRTSLRYCNPVDICSRSEGYTRLLCSFSNLDSALLELHTRYLTFKPTSLGNEDQCYHWAMAKEVMERIVTTSQAILAADSIILEEVSPMALHCTYRVAGLYIRMSHQNPSEESIQALEILKDALRLKTRRWRLAGEFSRAAIKSSKLNVLLRCLLANLGSSTIDAFGLSHVFYASYSRKPLEIQIGHFLADPKLKKEYRTRT